MARAKPLSTRSNVRTARIDRFWRDIEALRARRLGYRHIAEALDHFHGERFTPEQVQYALQRYGEPPMVSKARR